jgi:hypothetical protein
VGQQFLEESASQLTYHGLCELNAKMGDGELAVFFRNNHFSTIYKQVTLPTGSDIRCKDAKRTITSYFFPFDLQNGAYNVLFIFDRINTGRCFFTKRYE